MDVKLARVASWTAGSWSPNEILSLIPGSAHLKIPYYLFANFRNVSKSRWCEIGQQLFLLSKITFGTKKSSLVKEVTWRSKNILNYAWKYQLWGCRPNIIVIFHLKNIFQLMLYWDIPTFKLCLQGKFLFSAYRRETWTKLCTFPAFSFTMESHYLSWVVLEQDSQTSEAVMLTLKLLYFQNWFWLRSFGAGNPFCIAIRRALFLKSG